MNIEEIQKITIDYKKLIEARKEANLSQSEATKALGIDRRQIWQYENGVALPLENFTKLMMLYNKPIEFFIEAK